MIRPSRTFAILTAGLAAGLLMAGCSSASPASTESPASSADASETQEEAYMLQQSIPASFNLTTTSLKATGFLQSEFTCEGTDSSPHIAWGDVPPDTQSIAVVAEDLNLAGEVASHWLVWGLSADTPELPAGASGSEVLPTEAVEGVNDGGKPGYSGPCPPPKIIKRGPQCKNTGFDSNPYIWNVYAIDKPVSLGANTNRDDLLRAIDGSILAGGSIDVKYISKTLLRKEGNECW